MVEVFSHDEINDHVVGDNEVGGGSLFLIKRGNSILSKGCVRVAGDPFALLLEEHKDHKDTKTVGSISFVEAAQI
ncbi:MAG: hypothetical protein Q9188_004758 [Gyalolechia gomerana]